MWQAERQGTDTTPNIAKISPKQDMLAADRTVFSKVVYGATTISVRKTAMAPSVIVAVMAPSQHMTVIKLEINIKSIRMEAAR